MKKWITTLALIIGLVAAALLVGTSQVSADAPAFLVPDCICLENSDHIGKLDFMAYCNERAGELRVSFIQPVPPTWDLPPSFCPVCFSAYEKHWVCLIKVDFPTKP